MSTQQTPPRSYSESKRSMCPGYVINLLAGIGWFVGAVFDHLPDVLSSEPYRAGLPSKLLEVLVMVFGLALIYLSGRLLLARRRTAVR